MRRSINYNFWPAKEAETSSGALPPGNCSPHQRNLPASKEFGLGLVILDSELLQKLSELVTNNTLGTVATSSSSSSFILFYFYLLNNVIYITYCSEVFCLCLCPNFMIIIDYIYLARHSNYMSFAQQRGFKNIRRQQAFISTAKSPLSLEDVN